MWFSRLVPNGNAVRSVLPWHYHGPASWEDNAPNYAIELTGRHNTLIVVVVCPD